MLAAITLAIVVLQGPASAPPSTAPAPPKETRKAWPPEGVFRVGDAGVRAPRPVKEARPNYTSEAMRQKIQGVIVLEAIVEADGKVGDVRVKQPLDREFGLDDEAVKALKRWRFEPGRKGGAGVRVLVEVELTFTLRN